jgi:hypothetical protein
MRVRVTTFQIEAGKVGRKIEGVFLRGMLAGSRLFPWRFL